MRPLRRLRVPARWIGPAALLVLASCGQTPAETEKARGLLTGAPVVLALSLLFLVLAVGAISVAVVVDRSAKTRRSLTDQPPAEEEVDEGPEVVAGITVGRAPVPRWLYGAYVLIPVFALAYVLSNVAVTPTPSEAAGTPKPTGPCTDDCTIAMAQIQFTKSEIDVAAGKPISVTATNNDSGVPHTFTVWPSEAAAGKGAPIADTGTFGAGSKTAKFKAPAAGKTYYFDCTVHPASMKGEIVAK